MFKYISVILLANIGSFSNIYKHILGNDKETPCRDEAHLIVTHLKVFIINKITPERRPILDLLLDLLNVREEEEE